MRPSLTLFLASAFALQSHSSGQVSSSTPSISSSQANTSPMTRDELRSFLFSLSQGLYDFTYQMQHVLIPLLDYGAQVPETLEARVRCGPQSCTFSLKFPGALGEIPDISDYSNSRSNYHLLVRQALNLGAAEPVECTPSTSIPLQGSCDPVDPTPALTVFGKDVYLTLTSPSMDCSQTLVATQILFPLSGSTRLSFSFPICSTIPPPEADISWSYKIEGSHLQGLNRSSLPNIEIERPLTLTSTFP